MMSEPQEKDGSNLSVAPRSTILLATSVDLRSDGIGALFLRDLISSQPCVTFSTHQESPFLIGGEPALFSRFFKLVLQVASTRVPGFHSLRLRAFKRYRLKQRVEAIAALADALGAECVWVTASSGEMIWIAERLSASGRDVRVTVWDAPEYLCQNLRLDRTLRAAMKASFGDLLRQARAVSVIGLAMREDYQKAYGVSSEIIRHGVAPSGCLASRKLSADQPVRIVFAGSLYSKREWNSFVHALDSVNWVVAGRPILLHFMGRFPFSGARKPRNLILLGEKPFSEALRILSTMDIGYLPYWFDKAHKLVARTSFPGKLSAYAASGLSVFHHAPAYTEVTEFLNRYPFGVACSSLKAAEVVRALENLLELAATDVCCQARMEAVQKELCRGAMASRLLRFLKT